MRITPKYANRDHKFSAFLRANDVDWVKTVRANDTSSFYAHSGELIALVVYDNHASRYYVFTN